MSIVVKRGELVAFELLNYCYNRSYYTEKEIGDVATLTGFHFPLGTAAGHLAPYDVPIQLLMNTREAVSNKLSMPDRTHAVTKPYSRAYGIVHKLDENGNSTYMDPWESDSLKIYTAIANYFDQILALSYDYDQPIDMLDVRRQRDGITARPIAQFNFYDASDYMLPFYNSLFDDGSIKIVPMWPKDHPKRDSGESRLMAKSRHVHKAIRDHFTKWALGGGVEIRHSLIHR